MLVGTPSGPDRSITTPNHDSSPNLASRAGLEVGDRIVEVNGMPIDGIGSLMRVYQQVKCTPSLGMVSVTVERHDLPVTLTYRIR